MIPVTGSSYVCVPTAVGSVAYCDCMQQPVPQLNCAWLVARQRPLQHCNLQVAASEDSVPTRAPLGVARAGCAQCAAWQPACRAHCSLRCSACCVFPRDRHWHRQPLAPNRCTNRTNHIFTTSVLTTQAADSLTIAVLHATHRVIVSDGGNLFPGAVGFCTLSVFQNHIEGRGGSGRQVEEWTTGRVAAPASERGRSPHLEGERSPKAASCHSIAAHFECVPQPVRSSSRWLRHHHRRRRRVHRPRRPPGPRRRRPAGTPSSAS